LELASTHAVSLFAISDELKFKAAVAYYPLCGVATQQLSIPTIILIGELDDWMPAKDLRTVDGMAHGQRSARQAGHISWGISCF